ncbi:site-specific integrase [Sphingobacteriaceae bacterium WQ 2009]|uniref:Site-specific integrase n=1 Tax=Rhinopithecimicrobium faecis TaxID=2820698 RepID=A0A8T4HIE8_9SPHI|nr:site-specific integrase [Sphingobacteriaceae bacterium WQ 2009]
MVSLSLEVYISTKGNAERVRLALNLQWPANKVDTTNSVLMARFKGDEDVNDFNMIVMTERAKLNEIAKIYRLSGKHLDLKSLKRELTFADSNKSLVAYMLKRRRELFKNREISEQTYKNYGTTINSIKDFREAVSFDHINVAWMSEYKAFLKRKGNAHNTIWTRLRDLKSFLRIANQEATIYVDQAAIDFKNTSINTPITYLNRVEIGLLMKLHDIETLSETEYNVLSAFLFSCFTSLRVSDIYNANKNWMLSDNFLTFTMKKNSDRAPKTIKIPLIPIAQTFISATFNKFFDLPSSQEYNRTLKDLAKMAGIRKNLTSHVGRHTFGFLFMTAVGDIYALKNILGHSKITTTERYAHIDEEYEFAQVLKLQEGF